MREACQYLTTSIVMTSLQRELAGESRRGAAYEMGIKLLYRMMNVRISARSVHAEDPLESLTFDELADWSISTDLKNR